MMRKTIHLPVALVTSIEDQAVRQETDFSKLVRDTLKERFGLLRIAPILKPKRK